MGTIRPLLLCIDLLVMEEARLRCNSSWKSLSLFAGELTKYDDFIDELSMYYSKFHLQQNYHPITQRTTIQQSQRSTITLSLAVSY